jgi:hypothetical protein
MHLPDGSGDKAPPWVAADDPGRREIIKSGRPLGNLAIYVAEGRSAAALCSCSHPEGALSPSSVLIHDRSRLNPG